VPCVGSVSKVAATRSRRRAHGTLVPGSAPPGSKLAATVADKILRDVMEQGWPAGQVLASEPELIERYGVSRAVLREAVRLLEHQGVARMRRGAGGGLVVTEPTVDSIIDVAVLYLHRVGATADEVLETRLVLEEIVTELAPKRLRESDFARLRDLMAAESSGAVASKRAMHELLASMTGNVALELFVEILDRVMLLYVPEIATVAKGNQDAATYAHAKIASAVMAGDESTARRRMRTHLEAEMAYLRRRRSTRQVLDPDLLLVGRTGSKRGEKLAREILRDIVAGDVAPGTMIGMEPELIAAHSSSRAVFREAVRILEHHHVVTMRRGRGGGLYVVAPNAQAVSDIIAISLARRRVTVGEIAELRTRVELAVVERVIKTLNAAQIEELQQVLVVEQGREEDSFTERAPDLHSVIAGMTGNRVLELVVRVLVQLTWLYQADALSTRARREIEHEIRQSHGGVVEAMTARDVDLARHRMRRHLEVVAEALT
jgi:DNA-binding FadR family transcriptional regulator